MNTDDTHAMTEIGCVSFRKSIGFDDPGIVTDFDLDRSSLYLNSKGRSSLPMQSAYSCNIVLIHLRQVWVSAAYNGKPTLKIRSQSKPPKGSDSH